MNFRTNFCLARWNQQPQECVPWFDKSSWTRCVRVWNNIFGKQNLWETVCKMLCMSSIYRIILSSIVLTHTFDLRQSNSLKAAEKSNWKMYKLVCMNHKYILFRGIKSIMNYGLALAALDTQRFFNIKNIPKICTNCSSY